MIHYDFEVFSEDWMLVAIDDKTDTETRIHNDDAHIKAYYSAHRHDVWAGFNANNYDKYILGALVNGLPEGVNTLKEYSNLLVGGGDDKRPPGFPPYGYKGFDTRTEQYRNLHIGLKQLEGMAGFSIVESSVPFDIQRKLTGTEVEEVMRYCSLDAQMSRYVFDNYAKSEYETKQYFIDHYQRYGLRPENIAYTKARVAAVLLDGTGDGAKYKSDITNFHLVDVPLVRYRDVLEWRQSGEGRTPNASCTFNIWGIPHTFGDGGLHGASDTPYEYEGKIYHVDVNSYYPSMMVAYGFGKRVMRRFDMLKHILDRNLELKRKGDKKARLPYKILANSVFGQTGMEYSKIYDPVCCREVCVTGQMLLLYLIELLETNESDALKLIQSNTDGLFFELRKPERLPHIRELVREWEKFSLVTMGEDVIDGKIVQRDVNNYIICGRDGEIIEAKGAGAPLREYNYNFAIAREAGMAYLTKGTPIAETVRACKDLRKFQLIVHVGGGAVGIRYGEELLKEKTIRVFAAKSTGKPVAKVYRRNGKDVYSRVPDSPKRCFIDNGNINGKPLPDELNIDWYIALAERKAQDWLAQPDLFASD